MQEVAEAEHVAAVAYRRQDHQAHLDLQETMAKTEDPEDQEIQDPMLHQLPLNSNTNLASTASKLNPVHLVRLDLQAPTEILDNPDKMPMVALVVHQAHLVHPALQDNPEALEMLVLLVHLDKFTMFPEAKDPQAQPDLQETMDNPVALASLAPMDNLDHRDLQETTVRLDPLEIQDQMASLEKLERMVAKAPATTAHLPERLLAIRRCGSNIICHFDNVPGTQNSETALLRIILLYCIAFVVYSNISQKQTNFCYFKSC